MSKTRLLLYWKKKKRKEYPKGEYDSQNANKMFPNSPGGLLNKWCLIDCALN